MIKQIYKKLVREKTRNELRNYLNRFISLFYWGDNLHCNCCNKHFRKFLSKGHLKRQNAQCPYCGSLERTRLLLFYLQNETTIFKKHARVLHIAPEVCLYNVLKKQDLEYIDGDINPALANYVVDITAIQFPNNHFDLIICSHVLGHVPNEQKALQELKRVLNPEGKAILMTLLATENETTVENAEIDTPQLRLVNYGEPDLCRLHGRDFAQRIKNTGFKVSQIEYNKQFDEEFRTKYLLGDGKREVIFLCTR